MGYVPDSSQLRGMSYEKASLYGMPHIGCKYRFEDIRSTVWDGDARRCAYCGKVSGRHNRHHEPPKANGLFVLHTKMGSFVLLPALIDLCGSGTEGCHGLRHSRRLKIRWEWDSDEDAEKWWSGWFLSRPYHEPHGVWLYNHGCYVFEMDGSERRYRG